MMDRSLRLAAMALACLATCAHAEGVKPPPLPIGSTLARPAPGMSEAESKRAERAHHHKFENGRDYTRDDSIYGPEKAVQPVGARAGGSAAAVGGAGAGPAREKTDKGASSYFFGTNKK
jgi:hypothetical protein